MIYQKSVLPASNLNSSKYVFRLKHPQEEPWRLDSLYQPSYLDDWAISLMFISLGIQESLLLNHGTLCPSVRNSDNIEVQYQILPATLARSVAKLHQLPTALSSGVGLMFSNTDPCVICFYSLSPLPLLLWLWDRNNFHDVIMLLRMYMPGNKCITINYLESWI